MRFSPGTLLGPYEVRSLIGAGGMGEVYRGRDTRLDRDVAIKAILPDQDDDPGRAHRFDQEARAAGALSHPNVCAVYDVGSSDGAAYLVMELLEGESLRQRLLRGPLSLRAALELGVQAASGLIAAHDRGIVHRDLKPENLFLSEDGVLKILDFGLAKLVAPVTGDEPNTLALSGVETRSGTIVGTVGYMAPEQVRGEPIDARTDVFALGVVLFEMLTGRRPFDRASGIETLHAILHDDPLRLGELRPDAPVHLGRVLRRCLSRDPDRRIQTARDVRNELDALLIDLQESDAEEPARTSGGATPVERQLILTVEMVRELEERLPRLVGYPMTWLDNQVESQTLVILVWGGTGGDAGAFDSVLRSLPYRAMAPTFVGFKRRETNRPALGLDDHSRLLRRFFRAVVAECHPERTILVGFSASADQLLRMNHDEAGGGLGIPVDALLLLGSNLSRDTCFVTSLFSRLDAGDPRSVLTTLRALTTGIESLPDWLVVQQYISQTFLKLGTDLAPMKRFAVDLCAPFETQDDPLGDWYRAARRRIPHLRLVYSDQEAGELQGLLARHLESNVLGDEFDERSFVVEPVHHFALIDPSLLERHIDGLVADIKAAPRTAGGHGP